MKAWSGATFTCFHIWICYQCVRRITHVRDVGAAWIKLCNTRQDWTNTSRIMCFSLRSAKLKLVSSQLMRKRRTADATVHYFECTITPKSRMLDSCLAVACTSKHYLLWVTFLCMSFWVTFLYTSFLLHIRTIALHRLGIFSSASYHLILFADTFLDWKLSFLDWTMYRYLNFAWKGLTI